MRDGTMQAGHFTPTTAKANAMKRFKPLMLFVALWASSLTACTSPRPCDLFSGGTSAYVQLTTAGVTIIGADGRARFIPLAFADSSSSLHATRFPDEAFVVSNRSFYANRKTGLANLLVYSNGVKSVPPLQGTLIYTDHMVSIGRNNNVVTASYESGRTFRRNILADDRVDVNDLDPGTLILKHLSKFEILNLELKTTLSGAAEGTSRILEIRGNFYTLDDDRSVLRVGNSNGVFVLFRSDRVLKIAAGDDGNVAVVEGRCDGRDSRLALVPAFDMRRSLNWHKLEQGSYNAFPMGKLLLAQRKCTLDMGAALHVLDPQTLDECTQNILTPADTVRLRYAKYAT